MKHDLTVDKMCLSIDITVTKITPICSCRIIRKNSFRARLIILTGKFTLFGLCSRYSALWGLTSNLFDVINENASLIHDSNVEKAYDASSGENDN